jgi:MoxR-like ATPase
MTSPDPKTFPAVLPLGNDDSSPAYILDNDARLAVRMAWITNRPLLVVGEPGCGKTDLARAVATAWKVPLLPHVVHARTEAADLLFHFDAVARLADAQIYATLTKQGAETSDPLAAGNYIRPGVLWWLIDHTSALALNECRKPNRRFEAPKGVEDGRGAVVLIDEIDKGNDEVSEGLLEVLDTQSFIVPWTGERIHRPPNADQSRRLTIITSNGAREMPAPFLRRCIALSMTLPTDSTKLTEWLIERAKAHQGKRSYQPDALSAAAEVIVEHRREPRAYQAGLAEFLYLLDAASELAEREEEQAALVKAFSTSVTSHKAAAALRV